MAGHPAKLAEAAAVDAAAATERESAGPVEAGSPRKALEDGQPRPALSGFGKSAVEERRTLLIAAPLAPGDDLQRTRHEVRQAVDVERRDQHEEIGIVDRRDQPRV